VDELPLVSAQLGEDRRERTLVRSRRLPFSLQEVGEAAFRRDDPALPRKLASTRVVYDEVHYDGREPGGGAHEDRPSVILRKFSSN
jgi:hypothetical protein